MEADRVGHHVRLPVGVSESGVEIADLAEAVTAVLERVYLRAEQVFAGIEVALPEPHRARIGVRDDHLGDRRTVDQRTVALAVPDGDLVKHKTLARIEADPEGPVLP